MVHYLSPHGLEQYSGGGWGTRDVCQGPVEMLLALGRTQALRDVLCRVMAAQNVDGDWPQWFMFFERERAIRAGDSNGDIVLWPLLVLAQYLTASGDAAVLEERVPFFDARGPGAGERASIWEHVRRALSVIDRRLIPGTALAAYGHGDWNDSLQPVDPRLRERLCSAWTVTLHVQALRELARALRDVGRAQDAPTLEAQADAAQSDFQRLLIADGVLAGYALFEEGGEVRRVLHPSDATSGVHYSALAMVHAIIEDLFTPQQAREHLQLIAARLFDRPMPYHGGPQRMFQRAESAAFFGREIGLMYTHAHLRYAQALAHVGDADGFFHALCQVNPIGIGAIVPSATRRQANCYYSSSDAAFEDRYQASSDYQRVTQGTIAFDGGWRVYSSGAGIALGLIVRRLLGVDQQAQSVRIDPVMPAALDGLRAQLSLCERPVEVHYQVGAAGCGVRAVRLNGAALAFTREANPHRPGAAVIARAALQGRWLDGPDAMNALEVQIG
jgi:CRISPR-associated protein Csx3